MAYTPLPTPTREVDVEFLVFVQRYATDLLKWDILSFFAHHPDVRIPVYQLAQKIGRNPHSILPELGDLKILGILEQSRLPNNQILYQLARKSDLRKMALKFADQLIPRTDSDENTF